MNIELWPCVFHSLLICYSYPSKCPLSRLHVPSALSLDQGQFPSTPGNSPAFNTMDREERMLSYVLCSYGTQCSSSCIHSERLLSCLSLLDLSQLENRHLRLSLLQLPRLTIEKSIHSTRNRARQPAALRSSKSCGGRTTRKETMTRYISHTPVGSGYFGSRDEKRRLSPR